VSLLFSGSLVNGASINPTTVAWLKRDLDCRLHAYALAINRFQVQRHFHAAFLQV
jgi:hypothetical protein